MQVQSEYCIYSALYETGETIENIVDDLHKGEALAIELIWPDNDLPLIRFENLFGEGDRGVINDLNKKCKLISKNQDDFELISGSDIIISIGEIDSMTDEDADELKEFIRQEFSIDIHSLTKTVSIYEWGASGYFVDFIINLTAGFSQAGMQKVYKFLKTKGYDYAQVDQFDLSKVKKYLEKNYEINPTNLKLKSTRTYENGKTKLVFSSRYTDYTITIDNKSNVLESHVRQLNQTNI
ncbi:hypothetical protein [Marivirga arenosa]|uniref:Uncharacterized protein n=1 Tax=Marivirga arenosa TaxID=3059076 RepID=A0AA49GJM0_9BACT|nr:hypothetical protein [Marivirga sp. BKB1-2]WKK82297.2 hypothetical protein QYS47_09425 [Marivirga sp. BKB1-2]